MHSTRWFREFMCEARRILELLKFTWCVIRRRVYTPTSAGAFQALAATRKIYQRDTPEGERAFFSGQAGHLSDFRVNVTRAFRRYAIRHVLYKEILSSTMFLINDGAFPQPFPCFFLKSFNIPVVSYIPISVFLFPYCFIITVS